MNATLWSNHAVDAADELGLRITFKQVSRNHHGLPVASAYPTKQMVQFPYTMSDEDTYLACMHEVGHCADPRFNEPAWLRGYPTGQMIVEAEAFAWEWALRNVIYPISAEGFRVIWRCFGSYLRKHGYASHPFQDTVKTFGEQAAGGPVLPYPEIAIRCGMNPDD